MKSYFQWSFLIFAALLFIFTGCGESSKPTLKVAATSLPHGEILEFIQPYLKGKNIELEILILDDFNTPNRALADREVDANFFQHLPFLEAQKSDFGYKLESLAAVHIEPMALYSKKYSSLKEIRKGALIALPSDASNQARALALLEQNNLITLKNKGPKTSLLEISDNPSHFHFIEMDSPLLIRSLDDADAAVISTNFALLGGLSPQKDALALEDKQTLFANIVAIRQGEKENIQLQALKEALTTQEVRQFIEQRYQGAVTPAF